MAHILLTNDDGMGAPGITALYDALTGAGHAVTMIAPDRQNSAIGHAITISRPLKICKLNEPEEAYTVDGTPADCVRLGLQILLEKPVDLVVSGINDGFNTGRYVHCSGTVAAALEGVLNRKPALALSLDGHAANYADFAEAAAGVGVEMVDFILAHPLSPGEMLNVNVPRLPKAEIRDYQYARLGDEAYLDRFYEDEEGSGFYVAEFLEQSVAVMDSDVQYLREGYITVTPLHWDMTMHTALRERTVPEWSHHG